MRFLFVDRIRHLVPGKWVQGIKHVTAEDSYLVQDSRGKFQFIPSLIGETLGQLAAWNVMYSNNFTMRPVAGVVSQVKMDRPAYVGDTLELEAFIDNLDETAVEYHGLVRVNGYSVLKIEGALGPLLPMDDFINQEEVRRQFLEIFPQQKTMIENKENWTQEHFVEQQTTFLETQNNTYQFFDVEPEVLNKELNLKLTGPEKKLAQPIFSFDRILFSEPRISLVAEKKITRSAYYFLDHFPQKPVLPMTVLLECKLNLAKEFIARGQWSNDYTVVEFRKIKMNEFIYPGDVIQCHVKLKQQNESELILTYRSEVEGKRVCVAEAIMKVIGD